MSRTAIVLFNLGGPDSLGAVKPFLRNLFRDPAILRLPAPMRLLLAELIATRRAAKSRAIYAKIGGRSPILAETEAQARALEGALDPLGQVKAFVAMRYWRPFSRDAARAVKAFAPDRIVLLPLYPQYSTTTTESSLKAWENAARRVGLKAPTVALCCYPEAAGFAESLAALTKPALDEARRYGTPRLLLSAHGLPKKIVAGGDPYQWQIEATARALVRALGQEELDWRVCYQSRVGPLEWLGPYTDGEIARAGAEKRPVVLVPIAFVSEHSETLYELDILFRAHAEEAGVPRYLRVPTVGTNDRFIETLAGLVRAALARLPAQGAVRCTQDGARLCPREHGGCALAAG
jgi:ferrochelatase